MIYSDIVVTVWIHSPYSRTSHYLHIAQTGTKLVMSIYLMEIHATEVHVSCKPL